jgi:hypothetical protein
METITLCHCGSPLHYRDPEARKFVERMIARHGEHVIVRVSGRRWKVPRHYIALHTLRGCDVRKLGFEEVVD